MKSPIEWMSNIFFIRSRFLSVNLLMIILLKKSLIIYKLLTIYFLTTCYLLWFYRYIFFQKNGVQRATKYFASVIQYSVPLLLPEKFCCKRLRCRSPSFPPLIHFFFKQKASNSELWCTDYRYLLDLLELESDSI